MEEDTCDIWEETILALQGDQFNPTKACAWTVAGVAAITFVVSSLTGNYSQVDKLWSIIPFVYCWIVVCDERTLLMAIVATLWGLRLTWNFNRRGGYKWPIWDGDEDYRWKLLQDGALLEILKNKIAVSMTSFLDICSTIMLSSLDLLLVGCIQPVVYIHIPKCIAFPHCCAIIGRPYHRRWLWKACTAQYL